MLHRIKSMLTDFSGNEGGENLIGCFCILMIVGVLTLICLGMIVL